MERFLEAADVGRLLRVTSVRVRQLANAGVLPVSACTLRGTRLFRAHHVQKLLAARAQARADDGSAQRGRK